MARNFDDLLEKDATFTVRGEKFAYHDVKPEVLSAFETPTNGKKDDEESVWDILDAQILLFIEEEQHERWKELRQREKEPVTIKQLTEILKWLMEVQTGRPTDPPSPSASGRGRTAASSGAA